MKQLLLLLSLITPLSGFAASGTGKVDASYIESVRQGSAPGSPAAGKARWYTLDSDGKFYVKNSAGTAKACTYSGDIVNADLSGSAAITNANLANMTQSTFKCRTTASTGAPEDCTALQSQAIVGAVPQLLAHQSTPSNPAAGSVKVYAKSDNNLYILDSGGTETQVVSGGGIDGFAAISGGDSSATVGSFSCQIFTTTGNRTLTVTQAGPVMFALVGGGGGGSHGGGGGGGVIDHYWEDVWVDPGSYTVAVGAGGSGTSASSDVRGTAGGNTTFAGFTAVGGGGGGAYGATQANGGSGGSGGGGGGGGGSGAGSGGTGTFNKPEVQGYAGGASPGASGGCYTSAGGGGAGQLGAAGASCTGGEGGDGLYSVVATLVASGTPTYWGGGGSGGRGNSGGSCAGSVPAGGTGGGGGGADTTAGTANTGGGGSGGCAATGTNGGAGGSGKAIICARVQGS